MAAPIPLNPNMELDAPMGTPGATYGLSTTSRYWSAVWVRPATHPGDSVDYDLDLLDGAGALLNSSIESADRIDFVAIDSNLRAPGGYQARTRYYGGTGAYQIGFAELSENFPPMSLPQPEYVMDRQHWPVAIKDVYLAAGECIAVRASNIAIGEMVMMASDPARTIQSRRQAAARLVISPTAPSQTFTYTAPSAGWYGFAILDEDVFFYGRGTYQRVSCRPKIGGA